MALAAGTAIGLASLLFPSKAYSAGEIINLNPGMDVNSINTICQDPANIGNTINFTSGTYQGELNKKLMLGGNRDYTFEDGTILRGATTENSTIFQLLDGNVNMTGYGTILLTNCAKAGVIGNINPYSNVTISGLTSEISGEIHYEWKNIKHSTEQATPDVTFSDMNLLGGDTGFSFQRLNNHTDENSPFIAIKQTTIDGLASIVVDDPINLDTGTLLGCNKYITNVALLNSNAIMYENLWPLFSTPENLAQLNVTSSLIRPEKNDFVADANDFWHDANGLTSRYPRIGGRLDLGGGNYIGSLAPLPNTEWNSSSGNWSDSSSWIAIKPNSSINAYFNKGIANLNTTEACNDLIVGERFPDSGRINMSSGSLNSTRAFIGKKGTGNFTQSGGIHNLQNLYIASDSNSQGTYEISGGSLFAKEIDVGGTSTSKGGVGNFRISGGNTVLEKLVIWDGGRTELSNGVLGTLASSDSNYALSIDNEGGVLDVLSGTFYLGDLIGSGTTIIEPGATLWVKSIQDGNVYVSGTLVLSEMNPSLYTEMVSANYNAVPEPATLAMLALGGLAFSRRRRERG